MRCRRSELGSSTKEGDSPVNETSNSEFVSRVARSTRNSVWRQGDHPLRLNTTWWPIVEKYCEGKVKRTPGGEWKRTWNPMFTSRQRTIKSDVVLFVERSGELLYVARLSTVRYEAEGKPSLKRAQVTCNRPETEWSIHGQDEVGVKSNGGPNWLSLKRHRMNCG